MPRLETYHDKYRYVRFERTDGILTLIIHDDGKSARWSDHPAGIHNELGQAFYDVGRDPANRVVIITGTGNSFLTEYDGSGHDPDAGTPVYWTRIYKEGKDLLMNLLDIEVPIIAAVNGPVTIHSEIPTMSDIVLATDQTIFADAVHTNYGYVPSDGVHIWWQMILGPNRGRHFLLTGQEIGAAEGRTLGFVAEVLPANQLMARAKELAAQLAAKPLGMLKGTRVALVQHIKRRMLDDLGYGLQIEALAAIATKYDSHEPTPSEEP